MAHLFVDLRTDLGGAESIDQAIPSENFCSVGKAPFNIFLLLEFVLKSSVMSSRDLFRVIEGCIKKKGFLDILKTFSDRLF